MELELTCGVSVSQGPVEEIFKTDFFVNELMENKVHAPLVLGLTTGQ